MRRLLLVAGVLLATTTTANAADREVLAELPNESEISAFGDVAVVSVLQGERYRLARIRGGRARILPIPPRDEPFDADVGPDTRGRPIVVYSRCADSWELRDCDLVVHRFGSRGEEPVRTASTPEASEYEPAIWRARIAWASTRGGRTQVLTRNRLAHRTIAARRIPRVETDTVVHDLDVRRRLVGLNVETTDEDLRFEDIRLEDLSSGRGRRLDSTVPGEGGQRWLGPTFAGHRLGWAMTCLGAPSGCIGRGPREADVRSGDVRRRTRYRAMAGYALMRGGSIEVEPGGSEVGDDPLEDPEFPYACGEPPNVPGTCAVIRRR